VVALLALVSGAAVANLYYVQPLLSRISHAFGVSAGTGGLLVSATQAGYVAGLALILPLGDVLERRRLISGLSVCSALAAVACAAAPGFGVLAVASLALGALAVVAQMVVALASTLASERERGSVVGTVMSGLLLGILLARTLSGLVAAAGGWRLTFVVAAVIMAVLAVVQYRALDIAPPGERIAYRRALRSVLGLIAREAVLRQRMVMGAFVFGAFSAFWTSIAFLLSGAPYHYSEAVIGLFGLAGAAGAVAAQAAGRLADRGHGRLAMTVFLVCLLGSWALLAIGRHSLGALIAGIVLLDLGVQGAQISNQTTIYTLPAEARSRLTTAYMVASFTGGLLGSILSAQIYGNAGWGGVCALGAGIGAAAMLAWCIIVARQRSGTARHGVAAAERG
jgi:predicted MFS family arabinose efflux permease